MWGLPLHQEYLRNKQNYTLAKMYYNPLIKPLRNALKRRAVRW